MTWNTSAEFYLLSLSREALKKNWCRVNSLALSHCLNFHPWERFSQICHVMTPFSTDVLAIKFVGKINTFKDNCIFCILTYLYKMTTNWIYYGEKGAISHNKINIKFEM